MKRRLMPPRVIFLLLATFGIVVALSISVVVSVRDYARHETTARLKATARGAATAVDQATPRFTLLMSLASKSKAIVDGFEHHDVPRSLLQEYKALTPGADSVSAIAMNGDLETTTLDLHGATISPSLLRHRQYFIDAVRHPDHPVVADAIISALPDRPLLTPIAVAIREDGRTFGVLTVQRATVTQGAAVAVAGTHAGLRVQVIDGSDHLVADSAAAPPGTHLVMAGPAPRGMLAWEQGLSAIPGWRVRVLWNASQAYSDLHHLEELIVILASIAAVLLLFHGVLLYAQNRRSERHLVNLNQDLETRNAELGQFNRAASHDLQTPLRAVSQNAGRLVRLLERDGVTGRTLEVAQRIEHVSVRCINMVEGLRLYSHVRESQVRMENVDLDACLEEALEDLEGVLRTTAGKVEHPDSLGNVWADPMRIRRLLTNLVGNGLKYHRTGVAPLVRVEPTLAPVGHIGVRVVDNGIGIAPEQGEAIFEPFERLHTDEEFEGNGLGLALARRIVERSGGTVKLDPPPPEGGSSFTFTLPETRHR